MKRVLGRIYRIVMIAVIIGCLILGVLGNGMQLIGMGVYAQFIVKGIILMLSIGYDTIQKHAKVKKVTKAA